MPSATPLNALPYMIDADPLADVATIMQTLAERIEALTPVTGAASVSIAAAVSGAQAVTFPVGKFAAAPRVFCTVEGTNGAYTAFASGITTSGATIRARHVDGTSTTVTLPVQWVAIGVDE